MTLAPLDGARRRRLRAPRRCTSTKTRVRWSAGAGRERMWEVGEVLSRVGRSADGSAARPLHASRSHTQPCTRDKVLRTVEKLGQKSHRDERAEPIHLLPNVSLPFIQEKLINACWCVRRQLHCNYNHSQQHCDCLLLILRHRRPTRMSENLTDKHELLFAVIHNLLHLLPEEADE